MVSNDEIERQAFAISGVTGVSVGSGSVTIYVVDEATRSRLPRAIGGKRVIGIVSGPVYTQ